MKHFDVCIRQGPTWKASKLATVEVRCGVVFGVLLAMQVPVFARPKLEKAEFAVERKGEGGKEGKDNGNWRTYTVCHFGI